jgi:hypothetical protein
LTVPAINPTRLDRQVEEAMAQAAHSEGFVRAIREIVEYYADRTKRSTAASEALIMSRVLRVPRPVLAAVCTAIHARPDMPLTVRLEAAESLWDLGYRETRHIAVCLVNGLKPEELLPKLERWSTACDDYETLHWMADEGLQKWWDAAGADTWRTLRTWMAADELHVRHLALLALLKYVERSQDDADLPKIFRLLKGAVGNVRGEGYTTLIDLVRALGRRSSQETTRYLIDEMKRATPGIRRMVRTLLTEFPPDLRTDLEAAL